MTWTPERMAELRQRWDVDGQSAATIGRLMGISKNAVIGKARRMGLEARRSPIKSKLSLSDTGGINVGNERKGRNRKASNLRLGVPDDDEPCQPVQTVRSTGTSDKPCQWPLWGRGRPTDVFCGLPARIGAPYCPAHCARAYVGRVKLEDAA